MLEQFDDVYTALPEGTFRLLAETEIESGLRWGELSELRVKDVNLRTRILTGSRTVVELNPKFHPEGRHFLVKDYPKDREFRRFKLSTQIIEKLEAHIRAVTLTQDDLLFQMPPQDKPRARITEIPDPETLGRTEPNEKGRTYNHGTLSAYTAGRCRCDYCRAAFTLYRAARRAKGKDNPRPRRVRETDGHIPNDWFRRRIWHPALAAAGRNFASWLLNGGADLQVVKERLGHASIATTERYLHTPPPTPTKQPSKPSLEPATAQPLDRGTKL